MGMRHEPGFPNEISGLKIAPCRSGCATAPAGRNRPDRMTGYPSRRPPMSADLQTLLDPKNDAVFKMLFARTPRLLADLINAVRADAPPIDVVEVINPGITPEDLAGKFIVLDVLARDPDGLTFEVEMQVRAQEFWSARALYYLARTFGDQLKRGENYEELTPVIGIHLLDFEWSDLPKARWCFAMRDDEERDVVLTYALQLYMVELSKAEKLRAGQAGPRSAFDDWVGFFTHWNKEDIMATITHEPVKQALAELQRLSGDEESRRAAFVRERALRDERSALQAAKQEGRQEGRREANVEMALNLLHMTQLDDATIAKATALSEDEVRRLREQA